MYYRVLAGKPGTRPLHPGGIPRYVKAMETIDWKFPKEELPSSWTVVDVVHEGGDPAERIKAAEEPSQSVQSGPSPDELLMIRAIVEAFPMKFPHENADGKREMRNEYWSTSGACLVDKVREKVGIFLWKQGGEEGKPKSQDWITRKVIEKTHAPTFMG